MARAIHLNNRVSIILTISIELNRIKKSLLMEKSLKVISLTQMPQSSSMGNILMKNVGVQVSLEITQQKSIIITLILFFQTKEEAIQGSSFNLIRMVKRVCRIALLMVKFLEMIKTKYNQKITK